jgi:hypothetical protein
MSPAIFQEAEARIKSDLDSLRAQDGYLGIRTLGADGQARCSPSPPLVPLDSIDPAVKDKSRPPSNGIGTNGTVPALIAAWTSRIAMLALLGRAGWCWKLAAVGNVDKKAVIENASCKN